jgi:hypothetical protein
MSPLERQDSQQAKRAIFGLVYNYLSGGFSDGFSSAMHVKFLKEMHLVHMERVSRDAENLDHFLLGLLVHRKGKDLALPTGQ